MPSDLWAILGIFACAAVYFWAVKTGFILRHMWPVVWLMLAAFWVGQFTLSGAPDWPTIGLGFLTGGLLALFAVEQRDSGRDKGTTEHGVETGASAGTDVSRLIPKPRLPRPAHDRSSGGEGSGSAG